MNTDWKAESFKHKAQGKGENSMGSCNEWEPLFVGKVTSVQNLLHFHLVSKSGSIPIHQWAPPPATRPRVSPVNTGPFLSSGLQELPNVHTWWGDKKQHQRALLWTRCRQGVLFPQTILEALGKEDASTSPWHFSGCLAQCWAHRNRVPDDKENLSARENLSVFSSFA